MKTFNELTKKELSQLSDIQFDAYVDIELANRGIVKPIKKIENYPEFAKITEKLPERDLTVYEVDGYTFNDLETAQKVSELIATLPQIAMDYNWNIGSEFKYAKEPYYSKPQISITKVYSGTKYEAIKEELKAIKDSKDKKEKQDDIETDSVIDYSAIDTVKYELKNKVRDAVDFYNKAEMVSKDYSKYFAISNDSEMAYTTLFTVYNIQDEEMKSTIKEYVNSIVEN